jgi:hypothetical protein
MGMISRPNPTNSLYDSELQINSQWKHVRGSNPSKEEEKACAKLRTVFERIERSPLSDIGIEY